MDDLDTREKAVGAGAVIAAAVASMCCILPAGLGAIGLSGVVVSAFFEPLRPYFLVLSGVLLAVGFYFSFRRPAEGEVCSTNSARLSRASRPTLLLAAIATAGFALFPTLAGLASGGAESLPSDVSSTVVTLRVDGMTCESCTPAVRARLLDVPGVIDAAVSYQRQLAEVRVRQERPPEAEQLIAAVEKAGYAASLVEN